MYDKLIVLIAFSERIYVCSKIYVDCHLALNKVIEMPMVD